MNIKFIHVAKKYIRSYCLKLDNLKHVQDILKWNLSEQITSTRIPKRIIPTSLELYSINNGFTI